MTSTIRVPLTLTDPCFALNITAIIEYDWSAAGMHWEMLKYEIFGFTHCPDDDSFAAIAGIVRAQHSATIREAILDDDYLRCSEDAA